MKLLTPQRRPLPLVRGSVVLALLTLGANCVLAQRAPAPSASDLAKYDKNHNGKLDPDEMAAMRAAEKSAATTPTTSTSTTDANADVVVLSPFEVVSEAKGYYQPNSISGTRLNSKIEDLGQSITVMTKEQMRDFAVLDINDVFDYMASTEGTGSYSQFDTDRTGAVVDQVSLNPNNANRVRGLGNANVAETANA